MWSTYDDQMSDAEMRQVEREWYGDDEPMAGPSDTNSGATVAETDDLVARDSPFGRR